MSVGLAGGARPRSPAVRLLALLAHCWPVPTEHGKSFGSSSRARWYIHGVPDPMDVPSSPGVGDRPGRRCGHAVSMGVIASEAPSRSGLEVTERPRSHSVALDALDGLNR